MLQIHILNSNEHVFERTAQVFVAQNRCKRSLCCTSSFALTRLTLFLADSRHGIMSPFQPHPLGHGAVGSTLSSNFSTATRTNGGQESLSTLCTQQMHTNRAPLPHGAKALAWHSLPITSHCCTSFHCQRRAHTFSYSNILIPSLKMIDSNSKQC